MANLTSFSSGIKSIQRGTISLFAGSGSATASISAVDTAKSFVNFLGFNVPGASTEPFDLSAMVRLTLTNSTTVTATHSSGADYTVTVGFEVIEFY